jgi:hypothetical protein
MEILGIGRKDKDILLKYRFKKRMGSYNIWDNNIDKV